MCSSKRNSSLQAAWHSASAISRQVQFPIETPDTRSALTLALFLTLTLALTLTLTLNPDQTLRQWKAKECLASFSPEKCSTLTA